MISNLSCQTFHVNYRIYCETCLELELQRQKQRSYHLESNERRTWHVRRQQCQCLAFYASQPVIRRRCRYAVRLSVCLFVCHICAGNSTTKSRGKFNFPKNAPCAKYIRFTVCIWLLLPLPLPLCNLQCRDSRDRRSRSHKLETSDTKFTITGSYIWHLKTSCMAMLNSIMTITEHCRVSKLKGQCHKWLYT